jgi:hypothetical protein
MAEILRVQNIPRRFGGHIVLDRASCDASTGFPQDGARR